MNITEMELITSCVSSTDEEIAGYVDNSKPYDGRRIRNLIKKHLPDLYEGLCLEFPNPYESQSRKGDGYFVYVHSAIEYVLSFR